LKFTEAPKVTQNDGFEAQREDGSNQRGRLSSTHFATVSRADLGTGRRGLTRAGNISRLAHIGLGVSMVWDQAVYPARRTCGRDAV